LAKAVEPKFDEKSSYGVSRNQTMAGEVNTEGNPQTGRFAPQWSVLKMERITGIVVEFFFFFLGILK
jgi:hypothetical protein